MSDVLETRLGRIEEKLDKLSEDLAEVRGLEQRQREHHDRLFGNGQPGIIKDVDRLKQDHRRATRIWPLILLGVAAAGSATPEVLHSILKALFQ